MLTLQDKALSDKGTNENLEPVESLMQDAVVFADRLLLSHAQETKSVIIHTTIKHSKALLDLDGSVFSVTELDPTEISFRPVPVSFICAPLKAFMNRSILRVVLAVNKGQ